MLLSKRDLLKEADSKVRVGLMHLAFYGDIRVAIT